MKKHSWILMTGLIALFSCEETIKLDLKQSDPKIVIEGLVTDRSNDHFVKISRSRGFYESGPAQMVSNAMVTVRDDAGNVYPFNESQDGYYVPTNLFTGVIGRTYTLSVTVNGQLYESQETLLRVAAVDSVKAALADDPDEARIDKGQVYDLLLYFKEPKDARDYYLFKFYRNDSLIHTHQNDVYVISDEILGEHIQGFPSPVYYAENDKALMEMFSLSRNAYLYYSDLSNLLLSDGGLFGPVPANPRTNISNGALGMFQASAVMEAQLVVQKEN